ncbi:NAD-dependent epimerase/dehydratase family protein [Microbacterium suwonense]|uniref:NAD-dependent epimerase/dehydratase domain-containing protein n=1 Tax=Microbacterium suwonense TaxID=683047 RepID=A0ABM8FU72_9MICO|nr:NAD-dependent epimerase/dehydratase family protein [Microbacterium suwonense]BDZ39230.1 hypothetical protein GCM10025863_18440 [Microbacterium suwonense]
MTLTLLAVAVAAFGVSGLAPFVFRPALIRWGVVDVPNERSSHSTTTLRAGGLGPLTGWIVGVGIITLVLPDNLFEPLIVGVATIAFAVLGFVDDLRSLRAVPRLLTQVALSVVTAVIVVGGAHGWIAVGLSALLIVGYVNTTNFMDGVNALSAMHGVVVGLAFVAGGLLTGTQWLSFVGAVIAASFVAFLPWNLRTAGFFLGDVGSYALGASIAIAAVVAIEGGVPPLLVLAPMAVYVADTVATMARRLLRGENITHAHRTHAYQRLTDTGMSHLAASGVVTAFAVANAIIGVVVTVVKASPWVGALAIAVLCAVYLAIPRWRGSRLPSTKLTVPPADEIRAIPADEEHVVRRWAVVGASGFVGSAVVQELEHRGYDIVKLHAPRLTYAAGADPDVGRCLEAAAPHPTVAELAEALGGVDVVVNAAGMAAPDSAADERLYGANTLLPAVVAEAAARAGVKRVIHLSSAAVQGRRPELDASSEVAPFSPYSHSKALGERVLLAIAARDLSPRVIILRATSVQGQGRRTTEQLIKLAHSPLASVAASGSAQSVVSSVARLAATVVDVGATSKEVPGIVLQPWEGMSVRRVLEAASGRAPKSLPAWLCRFIVTGGFFIGRVVPRLSGLSRRVEVMWFGQQQDPGWNQKVVVRESVELLNILAGSGGGVRSTGAKRRNLRDEGLGSQNASTSVDQADRWSDI